MKTWLYILAVSIFMCISGFVYAESVQGELADALVRLHILANSDSPADQALKLQVRDEILKAIEGTFDMHATRADVLASIPTLEKTAQTVLERNNSPYDVRVELEELYFPKKTYQDITLPKGRYWGIRVILGSGAGENWWCVAYPPLCFTDSVCGSLGESGAERLKEMLSQESYRLIFEEGAQIQYKLKVVELFQSVKERLF